MVNVYISADLEGVSNVIYPQQTDLSGGESYLLAVKQQHKELNCIIDTLIDLKVNKITVNDAHGSMDNIRLGDISPNIELISGKPKPVSMMACLDETYSCVFFVGYHAKAGSLKGVLAHTFSEKYSLVKINGKPIGEIELNAVYSGLLNIPVALVTGDDVACEEAANEIGCTNTVITKTAISTTSAKCKPENILMQELRSSVISTINNPDSWTVYSKKAPYTLELDFVDRKSADLAELLPVIKRISATEISYTTDNYAEMYKLLQFLTATLP